MLLNLNTPPFATQAPITYLCLASDRWFCLRRKDPLIDPATDARNCPRDAKRGFPQSAYTDLYPEMTWPMTGVEKSLSCWTLKGLRTRSSPHGFGFCHLVARQGGDFYYHEIQSETRRDAPQVLRPDGYCAENGLRLPHHLDNFVSLKSRCDTSSSVLRGLNRHNEDKER
jgi:hypothetical protein